MVPAGAQVAAALLERDRAKCHTIGGGRLTGRDRKDVTREKARDWPMRFLLDP